MTICVGIEGRQCSSYAWIMQCMYNNKMFQKSQIDGSDEYYANLNVLGIGDRAVFIGAIEIVTKSAWC
jgi:hypothetical protein